jgi:phosphatidylserine/phosphatidylglycerophosphate/cardiolipin synthase-like enzyme
VVLSASVGQPTYFSSGREFAAYLGLLPRQHSTGGKNASIDGELGVLGSSNVDLRSFQLNEEASLLLYGADAIKRQQAIQAILPPAIRCSSRHGAPDRDGKNSWKILPGS